MNIFSFFRTHYHIVELKHNSEVNYALIVETFIDRILGRTRYADLTGTRMEHTSTNEYFRWCLSSNIEDVKQRLYLYRPDLKHDSPRSLNIKVIISITD